jgi:hypothetical protein
MMEEEWLECSLSLETLLRNSKSSLETDIRRWFKIICLLSTFCRKEGAGGDLVAADLGGDEAEKALALRAASVSPGEAKDGHHGGGGGSDGAGAGHVHVLDDVAGHAAEEHQSVVSQVEINPVL